MDFKLLHKTTFNSRRGAFSKITPTEVKDSQITLTDTESALVIEHFGLKNINVGAVKNNPKLSKKVFFLFPEMKPIKLNLVFPKKNKGELRLYLSSRAGFKPNKGEVIFIYENMNSQLCIGAMPENKWINYGLSDEYDGQYQEELLTQPNNLTQLSENKVKQIEIKNRISYYRNPQIALNRFKISQFKCEVNNNHKTFISQSSLMPFVEAHHFVPMKFQKYYDFSLDNINNIITLCPNCHRAIHLATVDLKSELIEKLYSKRQILHRKFTFENILEFYNCINIPES